MRKIMPVILGVTFSIHAAAKPIVDLYGDESVKATKILEKYSKRVSECEEAFHNKLKLGTIPNEKQLQQELVKRNQLIEAIKKEGDYLYVDFGTVDYMDKTHEYEYTTIEVVKKDQPQRLLFTSPVIQHHQYKPKHDLINQMIEFGKIESKILAAHQMESGPDEVVCPVYHCVLGFDHPQLKPYLSLFNQGVVKQKQLVLNTLNHDSDPERRAAAAFLIGHFKDPREIVQTLSAHINDPSSQVRNNALRVIGSTIKKAKITPMTPTPYLELLKSTQVTDRNKAMHVLSTLAESDDAKPEIIQTGGANLISLLRLKQPINHGFAYQILKKISGKDFGEHHYTAWENWLASAKNKLTL